MITRRDRERTDLCSVSRPGAARARCRHSRLRTPRRPSWENDVHGQYIQPCSYPPDKVIASLPAPCSSRYQTRGEIPGLSDEGIDDTLVPSPTRYQGL